MANARTPRTPATYGRSTTHGRLRIQSWNVSLSTAGRESPDGGLCFQITSGDTSGRGPRFTARAVRRNVPNVEICLLGSLEVLDDAGVTLAIPGRRVQMLLAALALR